MAKITFLVIGLLFLTRIMDTSSPEKDPDFTSKQLQQSFVDELVDMEEHGRDYQLPFWGEQTWCEDSPFATPDYERCNATSPVNVIRLEGSTPNALRLLVLGGMLSLEQERCFTVDDPVGILAYLQQPLGLPAEHFIVQRAVEQDRIYMLQPRDYWNDRKTYNGTSSIPQLNYHNVENHLLKKRVLQHLIKLKSEFRDEVCSDLDHHKLGREFITLSIQQLRSDYDVKMRGSTGIRKGELGGVQPYMEWSRLAMEKFFGGRQLPLYVATDNCSVLDELRSLEPDWKFVSECDWHPPTQDPFLQYISSESQRKTYCMRWRLHHTLSEWDLPMCRTWLISCVEEDHHSSWWTNKSLTM
jgi:hypothetical protein